MAENWKNLKVLTAFFIVFCVRIEIDQLLCVELIYFLNEFHFSEVYRSVNYIESRAK